MAGDCVLPEPSDYAVSGIPKAAEWRSSDAAEAALSDIAVASIEWFGDPEVDNWIQLRNGFIGVVPNDSEKVVNVVLDASASERAAYESKFQGVAGDAFVVKVSPACNDGRELAIAADALPALLKGREGSAFFADLNARTSTIQVWLYAKDQGDHTAFRAATDPDLVQIVQMDSPPIRHVGGRQDDAQPHWGGARIDQVNSTDNSYCTSGFVVDTAQAGKAIMTAGHCGGVGDRFESGNNAYGEVTRKGNFPERDMMIINADNQNYDDDIYMNPEATGSIDVSGTRVVSPSNHVCLSGATSLTHCDLTVNGVNGVLCDDPDDPDTCTDNLVRYDRAGGTCRSGDSGGPVFSRTAGGNPTALVVGLHIGEYGEDQETPGCFAHKFTEIQNAFNVTVATSP